MNSLKRPWINLILAPVWFLIILIFISVYFGGKGISEQDIPNKITENTPTLILIVQILMFATLLLSSKKDNFKIFKNGWTPVTKLSADIFGGLITGIILAILYFWVFSPLQTFLQNNIGDYIPSGETISVLGKQQIIFFIANVLLAPFVEESLYRNYTLTKFLDKYSATKSTILTALMFGLLHWFGGFWYILMTGLLIGLPFAIIVIKRKSIVWVFTAHLALNLLEYIFIMAKT
jgi:membrane protease YdiL (CAAX protease family)